MVKNTYSVIEGILQVVNGQVGESIVVDFNVLDPDCVIKSIKSLQAFLHEDKDAIIGPATKVIESLSLLPS